MRVLLAFNHEKIVGGGEISFLRYIEGLKNYQRLEQGEKIEFAVFIPGRGEIEERLTKDTRIFLCEVPSPKKEPIGFAKAVRYLTGIYSEFLPDIVHINGSRVALCAGIAKLASRRKPKIIFHSRISEIDILDPLLLPLLDGIIANSQKTLRRRFSIYRRLLKVMNIKTAVIYNGVDIHSLREKTASSDKSAIKKKYGIQESKIVVSSAGRIEKGKGFEVFIELSHRDFSKDLCFVLAGEPSYDMKILSRSGKLILPGYIPEYELFAITDILVFPSLVDSFGNIVLEAGVCGIPCIVSKFAGVSEILEHKYDAIIVDPTNASELALAIESLICSEELKQRLSKNFLKKSESFSIDKHTEKVIEFYRSLLS